MGDSGSLEGAREACASVATPEKRSADAEVFLALAVGEQAVVADPDEASWQNMQEEAPDELGSWKAHDALGAAARVIFVAEGDVTCLQREKSVVRDRHAMGVGSQVLQHLLGRAEGWLCVDVPLDLSLAIEQGSPRCRVGEFVQTAHEEELLVPVGFLEIREILLPEEAAEHAHGEEKLLSGCDPAVSIGR